MTRFDSRGRLLAFSFLASVVTGGALTEGCSCGDETESPATPAGTGAAGGAGGAGTAGSATGGDGFDAGSCSNGTPCDGGVCAGGVCCDATLACDDACCSAGQVCNFLQCETPGPECVDASDCPPDSYCDYSLGEDASGGAGGGSGGACQGGAKTKKGKCLKDPPECPPDVMPKPGDPLSCLAKCEYVPPVSDFSVTEKYAWGGQTAPPTSTDVMMSPIVVQLDDDNCDGKVNQDDIPEIVFSTFTGGAYYKTGTLHVISVEDGQLVEKWSAPDSTQPGGGLAAGDLDGDGVPEIVACMNPGPSGASCCDAIAQNTGVIAFRADGTVFWTQTDTSKVHCGYEAPAIGDVDKDNNPEILVGFTLLDGATGAVEKELDAATTWGVRLSGLADLDGDGALDMTDGQRAYRADGSVIWDLRSGPDAIPQGYHGIGDFDVDGKPEVVVISSGGPHLASVVSHDPASPSGAKVVRKGIDINNGISTATFCGAASEYGGGPPTVADFDGDGFPDVGAAGAVGYVVLSGAKLMNPVLTNPETILWFQPTHDCSSAVTGSSVFDFNGDGKAEVIYSDEYHLWMYDGTTGANLIPSTCNTTGTLWEYPLVADVDNDGQADIVIASNAYAITCPDDASRQSGIRVFGSATGSWVRTRRIWNQHTYHITNVNEDGSIPANEPANWLQPGLNDYRLNRQPLAEFSAPDPVVTVEPVCIGPYGLAATVRNLGSASLPASVVVGFYHGAMPGTKLGEQLTTKVLYPAEAEIVTLPLPMAPPEVTGGVSLVYAIVDDTVAPHTWHECRPENNVSPPVSGQCVSPR